VWNDLGKLIDASERERQRSLRMCARLRCRSSSVSDNPALMERADLEGMFGDDPPLAKVRRRRGLTQQEMADAVGVSLRTYRRVERGEVDDPGVRLLHNCAIALGVTLYDIIPAEWYFWSVFSEDARVPPNWEEFFHPERDTADDDLSVTLPFDPLEVYGDWMDKRREALDLLSRDLHDS